MPCQDLFDAQSNSYKQKIINETKIKISIEAASTDCWKKYVGKEGLSFGIDTFGKSAPYKEIYKHFGLTAANITNKLKKMVMTLLEQLVVVLKRKKMKELVQKN